MQNKEWFETWFDTKYYHILYKNRNDKEAHFFMDNLLQYLKVPKDSRVLDLACGKGRHSIYLYNKNLNIVGVDLSNQSISFAKQFEKDSLQFAVHDMRKVYKENSFDYVFNLFTSFGYFEDGKDDIAVIESMKTMLKKNGSIVIDFLNTKKTIAKLVRKEEKIIDGIHFYISREVKNGFIEKTIFFNDKGKDSTFTERVKFLTLNDFGKIFDNVGLNIHDVFGNYSLDKFDEKLSDRLIMVLKKDI